MKLKQYNYCNVTEYYELDITEDYLLDLTEYLKKHVVNPECVPKITKKMIKDAYYGSFDSDAAFDLEFKTWKDEIRKVDFYGYLKDTTMEDLWDNYAEVINSDSYDNECELEDTEDEADEAEEE